MKNGEWEKVEDDNSKFMCAITKETKDLEKYVVDIFNQAIKSECHRISNNERNPKRLKFNGIFWKTILMPATLNKSKFLNDINKQFIDIEKRNPTCYVYEQSFSSYDIEKTHIKVEEREEEIEKTVKNALEKLGEIISNCKQSFSESSNNIFPLKNLLKSCNTVLGKCLISSPQNFLNALEEEYDKYDVNIGVHIAEHEPNINHRESIHFKICFNGFHRRNMKKATLTICTV
ncbi:2160_t:CDS:2 [Gigaspora margarita]|uniref:2160_t:CDS:1 n=1 Tax=Gigaspora margarita TaxID=4874 RepID=A0ABN7VNM8_GIGMA|nr:2160_t:CDS:2 [Gigaspora margarita]